MLRPQGTILLLYHTGAFNECPDPGSIWQRSCLLNGSFQTEKTSKKKCHKTIHWLPGAHSNLFPIPKCINRLFWPYLSVVNYSEDICRWLGISHIDISILHNGFEGHWKCTPKERFNINHNPSTTVPSSWGLAVRWGDPPTQGDAQRHLVSGELIGLKLYQSTSNQRAQTNRFSCNFSVYLWSLSVELVGHKVTWRQCSRGWEGAHIRQEDLCSSLLMRECGGCLAQIAQNLVFRRMGREKRFSNTPIPFKWCVFVLLNPALKALELCNLTKASMCVSRFTCCGR